MTKYRVASVADFGYIGSLWYHYLYYRLLEIFDIIIYCMFVFWNSYMWYFMVYFTINVQKVVSIVFLSNVFAWYLQLWQQCQAHLHCRWIAMELYLVMSQSWWRHEMEIFSALLARCAGNSPITGGFLTQRTVTRSFDGFFDLRLIIRLSKQWRGWWFERPSRPLWRHSNVI